MTTYIDFESVGACRLESEVTCSIGLSAVYLLSIDSLSAHSTASMGSVLWTRRVKFPNLRHVPCRIVRRLWSFANLRSLVFIHRY
jgi:hypothetical protein